MKITELVEILSMIFKQT